jgi:predicted ATPase/DNA-binding CsgD family transcriptional regulator
VSRLLAEARLLTLTGAGGTGKTRLALRVAEGVRALYPGGVWLVELATLGDPLFVAQEVAASLDVREEGGRTLEEKLALKLGAEATLLILDNCEHLLEGCASLVDTLLKRCPRLQVLATSREPLGVEGECVWHVPPMEVPSLSGEGSDPANLESVRLFVERARLRVAGFELTPENLASVAHICSGLDGVPLAIELAAARVRVLPVEEIASRLDERFRLFTSGNRSGAERQRTLSALMDWSYGLLGDDERGLFRCLAVFRGGFPLSAARAVYGSSDDYLVIDLLSRLVDKSLVLLEPAGGETRYRMLETVRQYAWEKLLGEGEEAALYRERHAEWYRNLAERSEDALLTDRQGEWLARMEREHDNLRAAISHFREREPGGVGELCLTGSLVWFWYFRGYVSEARGRLEEALRDADRGDTSVIKAKVLSAAGVMAYLQSDFAGARGRLEEALRLWRTLQDKRGTAFTLAFLGRVLSRLGERRAVAALEESVNLFKAVGERWGLALALDFLGTALVGASWSADDDRRVAALHEESIALYRELGHRWGIALELSNFGRVALRAGDFAAARERLDEALEIQREVGDKWMLAWTLLNRGDAAMGEGDLEGAGDAYGEGEALFRELGDGGGIAQALLSRGRLEQRRGDGARAAELIAESLALFRELGDDASIGEALEVAGQKAGRAASSLPDDLTTREADVLRLVAEGLTDAQIAERLVLSVRTVRAHLRSIYSKLGVNTRSAATRAAISRGLV